MANVAYKRVSTVTQKTDRQLDGLVFDKIFNEKCSAKTIDRPEWNACLDYLREGDSLTIHSLDRVCRSGAGDAVKIVEDLNAKNISVEFIKEGMKFNGTMSAAQKGVLGILASVAQMERDLINERRIEGIAVAKAKGKKFGRPSGDVTAQDILDLTDSGMTNLAAFKQLDISKATGYRVLKAAK
jgi:DNA invertase Pin-like site-specific DNA recombinase